MNVIFWKKNSIKYQYWWGIIKAAKKTALDEGLKLSDFIKNILLEKISSELKESKFNKNSFSDKDAINCTNFIKSLFKKKFLKSKYN